MTDYTGYIYAIEAQGRDAIKIGFTTNKVKFRMAELQTANPDELRLIASWPGTLEEEEWIHTELKEWHIAREWFKATRQVLTVVRKFSQEKAQEVISTPLRSPAPRTCLAYTPSEWQTELIRKIKEE